MFRELKDYIQNQDFQISYTKKGLNINNYIEVKHMEEKKISLKYIDGTLLVRGNHLAVRRLLDQEILIVGEIKSIEFDGEV